MSTYAVFGMTRHHATEMAKKQINCEMERRGTYVPESEWLQRVKERAESIMGGTLTVQLSDKFDAPQFAEEFKRLAAKSESRNLHIKAYTKTNDRDPRTGRPKHIWTDQLE